MNIDKILRFSSIFEKMAQVHVVSLHEYVKRGLLDLSPWSGKKAKEGFSLSGKPYPANYNGGYNPDGSGLPVGFDDDVAIEDGMSQEQIQNWVSWYLGETDPQRLQQASQLYQKFPLATRILASKGAFIKLHSK